MMPSCRDRDAASPADRKPHVACAAFSLLTPAPPPHATAQAARPESRPARRRRLRSPGRPRTRQAQLEAGCHGRAGEPAPRSTCSTAGVAADGHATGRGRGPRRAAPRRAAPPTQPRAARAAAAHRRPGQAVRARHQRADARPDVAVPLRGARHLPADDHAGGTRRPQEGHERSGAQRAPGQPRPRCAGRRRRQRQRRHRRPASRCPSTGHREAGGKLFFQTTLLDVKLPAGLPQGKADNQILGVVQALREQQPGRDVVLVSKDINMRVKARALGLPAEDYFNDKTLDDGDLLYTGVLPLPADFWERHGKTMESWQPGRPHLLPHHRPDGAGAADQPVRLSSRRPARRRCTRGSPRSPARPRC